MELPQSIGCKNWWKYNMFFSHFGNQQSTVIYAAVEAVKLQQAIQRTYM